MTDFAPSSVRQPVLDRPTRAFVAQHSCPPSTHDPDLERARRDLARLHGGHDPLDHEATSTEWLALSGGPTGHVRVQVVRPVDSVGPMPVVLYLHGLGWSLGDARTHEHLVRACALGTDAAVVFVDYERAPEARYPVAVEQCYAVAKWICEQGGEIGLDGSRMAAVGDSAGGNLVAALTLLAKERGEVRLVQQVLLYPITDADFDTPSYQEFAKGYFLDRETMRWFWDQYLPDVRRRGEATASPLRASLEQLAGLPPALVVTSEADVVRDEGEAYAARLRAAGVAVVSMRYHGTVHGFMGLRPLRDSDTARAALTQVLDTVHVALHRRLL
ncbi:esterase [Streptomyces hygroscopicus subsp. hygroscopicus]|uniref:alpha/beta hydrolase n=1 Tax=Streptomyces sp. KHY 26 TaxID=3097359 RepID=UPI0024A4F359|nr:alpha/beta hydrolase [Streptomyces hygroscopicus]GLX49439.1 esterase [Streptomyces hygroscopicus subsp. hygroscopicus]